MSAVAVGGCLKPTPLFCAVVGATNETQDRAQVDVRVFYRNETGILQPDTNHTFDLEPRQAAEWHFRTQHSKLLVEAWWNLGRLEAEYAAKTEPDLLEVRISANGMEFVRPPRTVEC